MRCALLASCWFINTHTYTHENTHIREFLWWWVNYSMLFNNIKIKKTQFEKCAGNGNARCVRRKQYILFLFFIYKSIRFAYIYVCVFVHMHSTVCIHETLHFKLVHIYFYYYKHNLHVLLNLHFKWITVIIIICYECAIKSHEINEQAKFAKVQNVRLNWITAMSIPHIHT